MKTYLCLALLILNASVFAVWAENLCVCANKHKCDYSSLWLHSNSITLHCFPISLQTALAQTALIYLFAVKRQSDVWVGHMSRVLYSIIVFKKYPCTTFTFCLPMIQLGCMDTGTAGHWKWSRASEDDGSCTQRDVQGSQPIPPITSGARLLIFPRVMSLNY